MTKDDLIFDWRTKDGHTGRKLAAFAVVIMGFLFFLSLVKVRFDAPTAVSVKSASLLFFPDDATGRAWRLKAEEEGPFPGRLEIANVGGRLESGDISGWDDLKGWNDYSVELRMMRSGVGDSVDRIASKGMRYFPERLGAEKSADVTPRTLETGKTFPVLSPYSKEAVDWLPETLPPFLPPGEDAVLSTSWRFVLNLRADGSVAQCFALSGGADPALVAMISWLEGLRFGAAEEESRWMGLRVEFLNERRDGPDPE